MERLAAADTPHGALRNVIDAWFFILEEDILAEGATSTNDEEQLLAGTNALLEQRLARVTSVSPVFSSALRGYRQALAQGNQVVADSILAWVAG